MIFVLHLWKHTRDVVELRSHFLQSVVDTYPCDVCVTSVGVGPNEHLVRSFRVTVIVTFVLESLAAEDFLGVFVEQSGCTEE